MTPLQAEELATARWSAVSLERIADALEELCTWKEEERREQLRAMGITTPEGMGK